MPVHMWPTSHCPQRGPRATDNSVAHEPPTRGHSGRHPFGLGTYNPCGRDMLPWAQLLLPSPGSDTLAPHPPQCLPGTGLSTAQALTNTHTSDGQAPPSGIPVQ